MNKEITMKIRLLSTLFAFAFSGAVFADHKGEEHGHSHATKSPADAKLFIISPKDGEVVSGTFKVKFGLKGMDVVPAGVNKPNSGHHHLLIDKDKLPKAGVPMGKDVMHFGKGQKETEITLEKGEHTLQLILGDMAHIPHDPMVVSKKIKITVK